MYLQKEKYHHFILLPLTQYVGSAQHDKKHVVKNIFTTGRLSDVNPPWKKK
jgi:hypothetical protein